MPGSGSSTSNPKKAAVAKGPVYFREASSWNAGDLRAERDGLAFRSAAGDVVLEVPYRDIRRARVLSTVAAELEPGCFDVVVRPSAYGRITGDTLSDAVDTHTLRFQTGALGIAAEWVGVVDDAAASASDETELARWWSAAARAPLKLPCRAGGRDHCDAASLPEAKPFEADLVDAAMRRVRPRSRADSLGDSCRGAASFMSPLARRFSQSLGQLDAASVRRQSRVGAR